MQIKCALILRFKTKQDKNNLSLQPRLQTSNYSSRLWIIYEFGIRSGASKQERENSRFMFLYALN